MLPTDQIMLKEQGEKASKLKTSINQAPNGSICRLLYKTLLSSILEPDLLVLILSAFYINNEMR